MTPQALVPRVRHDRIRGALDPVSWADGTVLALRRAEDGATPEQATTVRLLHDAEALWVRFDCDDRDIWATHTLRDAPLWEEEAVELFVAPGESDPASYFEFEFNSLGAIFDARVANPHGRRDSMRVDPSWNADSLAIAVSRPSPGSWRAEIAIPWCAMCDGDPPRVWRANFFRIERPRDAAAEFSCWSPTLVSPPDFHKPASFGTIVLDAGGGRS